MKDSDARHLVFSYGTLQLPEVQTAVFGGPVTAGPAAVAGHRLVAVRITDPEVVMTSGTDLHTGLVTSVDPADEVAGVVLALDATQLAAADDYESAYQRTEVLLSTGDRAWVYVPDPGAQVRRVAVVLNGLGSVGRAFLDLLVARRRRIATQHGVELVLVGVVDSRGAAVSAQGLDVDDVLALKRSGASVGELPGWGLPGASVAQVLAELSATGSTPGMLVEASPADLTSGGAGLAGVLAARAGGVGVVLANKAPLVLAWDRVVDAAGPPVRYSACAGAALPTVDLLGAAAVSASVEKVEIVLNSTCQRLLGDVEAGSTVAQALRAAQQAGLAEADPSLDVDGIDTAVKLVVLLRTLGHPVELDQVAITGIRGVTPDQVAAARRSGDVLVLLGTAYAGATWRLEVAPTALPSGHPLARMARDETGLVVHTDIAGTIAASGHHTDVTATAAAVLRDVLVITGMQGV